MAHNGLELLLFLIANSAIDVRGFALACVDILLGSKPKLVIGTEKDIVSYLSSILITKKEKNDPGKFKARAFSIISQAESMDNQPHSPQRPSNKAIDFSPFSDKSSPD